MKKFSFLLAVGVGALMATSVAAQESTFFSTAKSSEGLQFAVQAGLNLSNFYGSKELDHNDSRFGFNAGVTVDYAIFQSLGVKSGLLYTLKGSKYSEEGYEENSTAHYLEIPILASYRYHVDSKFRLDLDFGPYLAVGIAGKEKYEEEGEPDVKQDFFGDTKEGHAKRFDMGLQLGATFNAGQFYYGVQYQWGLVNLYDTDEDFGEDFDCKNKNFSVVVGYKF